MLGTLGSQIELKNMVVLTNETQTMLSFLRIFKFNAVICLNSIKEPNVHNLRNCTYVLLLKLFVCLCSYAL